MLVLLELLPSWVPSDALTISLFALLVTLLAMNKNKTWVLRAISRREPVAFALGIFVVFAAADGWLGQMIGFGSMDTWAVVGIIFVSAGLLSRYTGVIDL